MQTQKQKVGDPKEEKREKEAAMFPEGKITPFGGRRHLFPFRPCNLLHVFRLIHCPIRSSLTHFNLPLGPNIPDPATFPRGPCTYFFLSIFTPRAAQTKKAINLTTINLSPTPPVRLLGRYLPFPFRYTKLR